MAAPVAAVRILRSRIAWLTVALASAAAITLTMTRSDTGPKKLTATSAAVAVPTKQTFYYQVSAVNAAGEGPRSNEVKATIVPLTDFQTFVTDSQAAAYYQKWSHDNPGDLARWTAYRNAILASGLPTKPTMTSRYGQGLVDGGQLFIDFAVGG